MKALLLSTALVLGVAAQASANDQLARSVGVEPGVYTTAQLAQLKTALNDQEDGERHFDFLISKFNGDIVSTQSVGVTPGRAQLAASLGLTPADFTTAELAQIKSAAADTETSERHVEFLIDKFSGNIVSTQSVGVTPGRAQLAASLGLNPADYTTAELAQIKSAAADTDNSERHVEFLIEKFGN